MDTRHKVCIVGAEAWGSAIATAVGANAFKQGFDERVHMYVYDELINSKYLSDVINEQHENIKYLPGIKLPDNLVAVNDLLDATKNADILIFATDPNFLKGYLNILAGHVKNNAFAVSMIKGLNHMQDGEINLYSHVISNSLQIPCYSMMCASSALEMAQGKLCEITIGCNNRDHAELLSNVFQTNNCKVISIKDVDGVELCCTLKDILALGAGIIDGLRLGDNARVTALHLGLKEMMRFIKGFYPYTKLSTFFESCGVVNSVAFCYGDKNITFAKNFVLSGKTLQELEANRLNGKKLLGPMVAAEVNGFLRIKNKEEEFPLFTAIHKICQNELPPEGILDALRNHPDLNNHTIEAMLDKEHQVHDTEIINTSKNERYEHVPNALKDTVGSEKRYDMHFQIEKTEVEKRVKKLNNLVVVPNKQPMKEFGTENIQISFKNNPQPNVPNISLTLTADLPRKLSDATNKIEDTSKISSASRRQQMLTFWYKDLPHERKKLKKRQQQEKLRMAEKKEKLNNFDIAGADPDVSTRVPEWTNDNEWLGESQRFYEITTVPKKEPSSMHKAIKKSITEAKDTVRTINNTLPNNEPLNIRIRGKAQEQVKPKLSAKKIGKSETHSLKVVAATKDEKPVNDSSTETKDLLKTIATSQNSKMSMRNKSTLGTGGDERQEKREQLAFKTRGKSEREFNYEKTETAMETMSLKENSKQDHVEDSKKGEKKIIYTKTEADAVQQEPVALDYYKDNKLIEPTEKLLKEQEFLLKEINELQVTLMEREDAELGAQSRDLAVHVKKVKLDRGEVENDQLLDQGAHDAQLKVQSKDLNEYGKQVKLGRDDAEKFKLLEQQLDELEAQSRDIAEFSKEVKLIREEAEKYKLLKQKKDAADLEAQPRDLSEYGNKVTIMEREEADKHKLIEQEKIAADLESQFRDLAEYGKPVNMERDETEKNKLLEQEKFRADLEALSSDLAKHSKQIKLEREDAEQHQKNAAELKFQSKDVADQGYQATLIEREDTDKFQLLEQDKHAADLDSTDITEHGKPTKIERDEAKNYQLLEEEKYAAELFRNLMESEEADKHKLQEQEKFGADLEALSSDLAKHSKQIKLEREDAEQYQKNAAELKLQSKDVADQGYQATLIEREDTDKFKLLEQDKHTADLDSTDIAEHGKPTKIERDEAKNYQLLEEEKYAAELFRNLMESEEADKYKLQKQEKFGADLEALSSDLAKHSKQIKLEREDAEQYQKNAAELKLRSKDVADQGYQATLIEREDTDKFKSLEQDKHAADLDSTDITEHGKPTKIERDEAKNYKLLEEEKYAAELFRNLMESEEADKHKLQKQEKFGADLEALSSDLAKHSKQIKLEREDAEQHQKNAAELKLQSKDVADQGYQATLIEREDTDKFKLLEQDKHAADLDSTDITEHGKPTKIERDEAKNYQLLEEEKYAAELFRNLMESEEADKHKLQEQEKFGADLEALSSDLAKHSKQIKLEREDAEQHQKNAAELKLQSKDVADQGYQATLIEREDTDKFKLLEQDKHAADLDSTDITEHGKPTKPTKIERDEAKNYKLLEEEKYAAELFRNLMESEEADKYKLQKQEKFGADLEALSSDLAKHSKQIKLEREDAEQYQKNAAELKLRSKDVADQGYQATLIEREDTDKFKSLEQDKHAADLDSTDITEHGKPTKIERDEAKNYKLLEEEKYAAELFRNLMESEEADKHKLQKQEKFGADLEALSSDLAKHSKQIKLEREDAEQYQKNAAELKLRSKDVADQGYQATLIEREDTDKFKSLEQDKHAADLDSTDITEHGKPTKIERDEAKNYKLLEEEKYAAELFRNLMESEEADKHKLQKQEKFRADLEALSSDLAKHSKQIKLEREDAEQYQLLEQEKNASELKAQSKDLAEHQVTLIEKEESDKNKLQEQENFAVDLGSQSRDMAEYSKPAKMERDEAEKYQLLEQESHAGNLEDESREYSNKIKLERAESEKLYLLDEKNSAAELEAESRNLAEHANQVKLMEREEADKYKLQNQEKFTADLDSQSKLLAENGEPAKMERDEAEKYHFMEQENHTGNLEDESREYSKKIKLERSEAEKYNLVEQEKHAAELDAQSNQVSLMESEEADKSKLVKQEKFGDDLEALSSKQIKLEREDAEKYQLMEQEKHAADLETQSRDLAEFTKQIKLDIDEAEVYQLLEHGDLAEQGNQVKFMERQETDKHTLQEQEKFAPDLDFQSRDLAEYSKPAKMERDDVEKYQLLEQENYAAKLDGQPKDLAEHDNQVERKQTDEHKLLEQEKLSTDLEAQSTDLAEFGKPLNMERDEAEKYKLLEQEKYAVDLKDQTREMAEYGKHNEAHDYEWLNLNKGEGEETNSKKAHKQKLENIEDVLESFPNFESQKDREMYSRKIEDQAWEWLQLREKLNDGSKETSKTQAKEADNQHREEQLQQATKQEQRRESTNELVPKRHAKPLQTGMPKPIAQQPQTTKRISPKEQQSQPAATPKTSTSIFSPRVSNRITQESQLTRFSNTLHRLMQRGQRKPNKSVEKQISVVDYTGKNPYLKYVTELKKFRMHTIEPENRRSHSPRRRKLLMRLSYPPLNPRVRLPHPPFDARDKEYHTWSNTVYIPPRAALIQSCIALLPYARTGAQGASSSKNPIALWCSSSPLRLPGYSIMPAIMPRWSTVSKVLYIVQLGIFASLFASRKKNARSGGNS